MCSDVARPWLLLLVNSSCFTSCPARAAWWAGTGLALCLICHSDAVCMLGAKQFCGRLANQKDIPLWHHAVSHQEAGRQTLYALQGSIVVMLIGAIIAGATDLTYSLPGYIWVSICAISTAMYLLLIRALKDSTGELTTTLCSCCCCCHSLFTQTAMHYIQSGLLACHKIWSALTVVQQTYPRHIMVQAWQLDFCSDWNRSCSCVMAVLALQTGLPDSLAIIGWLFDLLRAGLSESSLLYHNNVLSLPLMASYMLTATTEVQTVRQYPQLNNIWFLVRRWKQLLCSNAHPVLLPSGCKLLLCHDE